jgi:hypothetical protein
MGEWIRESGGRMPRTCGKKADQAFLQALACGATVENAARKAGISERTAYRRLDNPAFVQQLQKLRADLVQRTASMLSGAGLGAVKTLVDLQQDAAVPAAVRRGSARDVLEFGIKYREAADWEQRVAALEERLADRVAPEELPDRRVHEKK